MLLVRGARKRIAREKEAPCQPMMLRVAMSWQGVRYSQITGAVRPRANWQSVYGVEGTSWRCEPADPGL